MFTEMFFFFDPVESETPFEQQSFEPHLSSPEKFLFDHQEPVAFEERELAVDVMNAGWWFGT